MTSDKQKLETISKILDSYQKEIEEAREMDGEVTFGGNGINSAEANLLFRQLGKEIRQILRRS